MGEIKFYSGNNAGGSNFYNINDTPGQSVNLKSMSGKNDVARSLKLVNCVTGVVVKVYDDPNAGTHDDWCEIEVLKQVPECVVGTFQPNPRTYVDPNGVYRQVCHYMNGLDGKVSHVKTAAAPPYQLDYVSLGKLFSVSGWNDKGGLACTFYSQGCDYRMYQPDAIAGGGGTIITTQFDNIRSGTDDHCYLRIEIKGEDLTTKTEFTWGSTPVAVIYTAKAAAWIASQIADLAGGWAASKMVDCLCQGFALMAEKIMRHTTDRAGRVNFNAVVNHSINKIVQSTRRTS